MIDVLDNLKSKLDELKPGDRYAPEDPVEDGEEVVGAVPEGAMRYYSYYMTLGRKLVELMSRQTFGHMSAEQKRALYKEAKEIRMQSEIVASCFWYSIKSYYGLWEEPSLGVRLGPVVVKTSSRATDLGLLDFLRDMLDRD